MYIYNIHVCVYIYIYIYIYIHTHYIDKYMYVNHTYGMHSCYSKRCGMELLLQDPEGKYVLSRVVWLDCRHIITIYWTVQLLLSWYSMWSYHREKQHALSAATVRPCRYVWAAARVRMTRPVQPWTICVWAPRRGALEPLWSLIMSLQGNSIDKLQRQKGGRWTWEQEMNLHTRCPIPAGRQTKEQTLRCSPPWCSLAPPSHLSTANLRTKILDFRGFDSSMTLTLGGIPRPIGNFPESLSQAILVGRFLAGRLDVTGLRPWVAWRPIRRCGVSWHFFDTLLLLVRAASPIQLLSSLARREMAARADVPAHHSMSLMIYSERVHVY